VTAGPASPAPSAADAARRILADLAPQPSLRVPLDDALGSVLAETVASPIALPPWTSSAMDGYACRAEDVRGATRARPTTLRVVAAIAAGGAAPARPLERGECARIFTGAPVPPGADGVVRQEDTEHADDAAEVRILDDRDAGANLRPAGQDLERGAVALEAGAVLTPGRVALLAALAVAHPVVHRRPRVGILTTGDELAGLAHADEILAGRRIADSNAHALRAQVAEAGGEPVPLGRAADDPASVRAHVARAHEEDCDLLLTVGGVSVGAHDHVRAVMESLGAELRFWRARIRPGGPLAFGILGGRPWLGLPGNPVSAMVTFELFARPAIRRLAGHALPFRRTVPVTVGEPVRSGPKLQHFLRVTLEERENGGLLARLTGAQGSNLLTSMARADALLLVPEGMHEVPAGTALPALRLDEARHQAEPPY